MKTAKKTGQVQPHPNEFDHRRIERALANRERYRYVTPRVVSVAGGYRIESPCCSRNIDPEGGVIDVAWIAYDPGSQEWRLYNKDHAAGSWEIESNHERLIEALEILLGDTDRKFWQ